MTRNWMANLAVSEPLPGGYRYELKVVSDAISVARVRSWLRLHPEGFRVAFPPRVINNLYFDTADLQSFNDNLSGVSVRRKLRLRWYDQLDSLTVRDPVLEIKLKKNILGRKQQQPLDIALDFTRTFREIRKSLYANVNEVWQAQMRPFTQATLINRYRREYYVSPDMAIRATLDSDLRAFDQRMVTRPNLSRRLPLPADVVVEVKAAPEYEKRLQEIMGYFPMARSRSSKYVQGLMGGHF